MSSTATTSDEIVHHTSTFFSEILSQSDLRRRIYAIFRQKFSYSDQNIVKQLNIVTEALETVISTSSNVSVRSSSLRLSEKLLNSYTKTSFSSFLLCLVYFLSNSPIEAAFSLLEVFYDDPCLARSEISPQVFEELFLRHFVRVLEWYNEQKSRILSSLSKDSGYDSDDHSICVESVGVSCTTLLSKMNGNQALELKELERDYEDVLDENCRVFVWYFKEVLENADENAVIDPPSVVLEIIDREDEIEDADEVVEIDTDGSGLKNGRYNPIWTEEEKYVSRNLSKFPSFFPERVSMKVLTNLGSLKRSAASFNKDCEPEPVAEYSFSSSDSEGQKEEMDQNRTSLESRQSPSRMIELANTTDSSCSPDPDMTDTDNLPGEGKHKAPRDFVCPITSYIFDDPVTLETGQTYERKAIQEWIDRGNLTCPITRKKLNGTQLPSTNYVLKRLIARWREENFSSTLVKSENQHQESEQSFSNGMPPASPDSVISQATIDGAVGELRHAIETLSMSEILKESETAVLWIERFWQEANMQAEIQTMLSEPQIINGFVDILFNSVDTRVLRATVFLLSELGSRDDSVIQTLCGVDPDVECVVALFKKGLLEAVVLVYLLKNSAISFIDMGILDSLFDVLGKKEDDFVKMCIKPQSASVLLLKQILGSVDEISISGALGSFLSDEVIENIVSSLEAEWHEERFAAVSILLRCIQEDGNRRNLIAQKAELATLIESFFEANDEERFQIVQFLSELVKLHRRIDNEQVLHIIKDEGTYSTMHTLLVYLQTALQDQRPVVAGLLLQLDILMKPRKASIYREEALDTIISCLKNSDFPAAQIAAAETILVLQGRFSYYGNPLARAFLLKRAGLDKTDKSMMIKDHVMITSQNSTETMEEENAAEEWEKKVAFALVSHEFGLLFEALAEGLKSTHAKLHSACFLSATWLLDMLTKLPDTGIQGAARACLLKQFVSIFKSAEDVEDRAISMLALSSFIHEPEGLHDMTLYVKDVLKGLRELKKSSVVASEVLKSLADGNDSSNEMWIHKELYQEDCSANGEVLSIVCFKDKIFSGHSDGTIKVWTGKGSILHLIQVTREHTKAVTSLTVSESGDKLYSGSLDKTVRAWDVDNGGMQCEHVYDMKDHVNSLAIANNVSYFIPYGAGIKVHSLNGASKLLNPKKYVKCLVLVNGKLFCGCTDNSIQEIDMATGKLSTIQSGSRNFMTKANPIYALQVHDGLLYSVSSPLDGAAVKIWSASNYDIVGSVPSTLEVRSMVVSSDLIYLGCKGGIVEVWCRKKLDRIETLETGTNGKILSMALDSDEEVLVIGTSDGRIQAWGLG
ncbi:putative E3 ubiquitin-protein ligase LIN-1 [Apium graveolens]|uniref:putative E3 ubiquitin-protein ligase LIN-1 n=1 Tax=Apium graveolens TaxID=4045 RepID=UPI003D7BB723